MMHASAWGFGTLWPIARSAIPRASQWLPSPLTICSYSGNAPLDQPRRRLMDVFGVRFLLHLDRAGQQGDTMSGCPGRPTPWILVVQDQVCQVPEEP